MSSFIDILIWAALLAGIFLGVSGSVGVLRFPDFYTRVHAASVTDTLCVAMVVGGLVLSAGFTLVSVKLILILVFLWYTSAASSHALVRAAHHMGLPHHGTKRTKDTP